MFSVNITFSHISTKHNKNKKINLPKLEDIKWTWIEYEGQKNKVRLHTEKNGKWAIMIE